LEPLGAAVEVVGEKPGEAALRKLLRSVFFKGMAAAVLEALEAARKFGLEAEFGTISLRP
jgi:3-hydroxyisobutyrate dehydrogenase-like beta-hydroxyacid dehydrogenase